MQVPDSPSQPKTTPREILITGTAGRGSIATMLAAILASAGQPVAKLDHRFVHSPVEQLTVFGASLPNDVLAAQHPATGQTWADDAIAQLIAAELVTWIVRTSPPSAARSAELVVFGPILPGERSPAESASSLCASSPPGGITVTTLQRESVLDVLRPACPCLLELAALCRLSRGQASVDGQEFRLKSPANEYRIRLGLAGGFQVENAAVAILAAEQLAPAGVAITPATVATALAEVRLPARCEIVKREPLIIVDAADTPASLQRFCETVRDLAGGRHATLVLELDRGLPPAGAVEATVALHPDLNVVLDSTAEEATRELREAADERGLSLQVARTVTSAVDAVLSGAGPRDVLCVAGSRNAAAVARAQVLGLLPPDSRLDYTGA